MNRSTVGAYNTLAGVNAYFSLLEHNLVLVCRSSVSIRVTAR